jgi:hypothetical protein
MKYAHSKREGAVRGHPCALSQEQVGLARKWKSENVPQDIIGIRLGCSESTVSRAVRGVGNYALSGVAASQFITAGTAPQRGE